MQIGAWITLDTCTHQWRTTIGELVKAKEAWEHWKASDNGESRAQECVKNIRKGATGKICLLHNLPKC